MSNVWRIQFGRFAKSFPDSGFAVTNEPNVADLAEVKVFFQAKLYKVGAKIAASTVRQVRQAIPFGGQDAFITTADFQRPNLDLALANGFPRIGLIKGRLPVKLLVELWDDILIAFQDRLLLKLGLVLA